MEGVLLEAKREYTEQVVSKITRPLYDEIYAIWQKSLDENGKSPMRHFQDLLENIAELSEKDMLFITDRCIEKSGCAYFGDLVTAIFVAHTRVLLSVRKEMVADGYRLQVPTPNRFLRACVVCCAREFWKSPYLFYQNEHDNKITKIQVQKNLREAETIIQGAIRSTIRGLLPLKDVLDAAIERSDLGDIVVEDDTVLSLPSDTIDTHPVEDRPTEDKPEEDKPEEDKPEEDTPTEDKPTKDKPTEDKPTAEDTPGEDKPVEDTTEDTPIEDKQSTDSPLDDILSSIQSSTGVPDIPTYEDADIPKVDSAPESYTIEIKGPPDDDILLNSVSDAISLDEDTDVTIEAEEL